MGHLLLQEDLPTSAHKKSEKKGALILDAPLPGRFSIVRVPTWLAASWRSAAPGSIIGVMMRSPTNKSAGHAGAANNFNTPSDQLLQSAIPNSSTITHQQQPVWKPVVYVKDTRTNNLGNAILGAGNAGSTAVSLARMEMDHVEPTHNLYVVQAGRPGKRRRTVDETTQDHRSSLNDITGDVQISFICEDDLSASLADNTEGDNEQSNFQLSQRRIRQISEHLRTNRPSVVPLGEFPMNSVAGNSVSFRLIAQAVGTRALKPTLDSNYREALKTRFRELTNRGHRTRINEDSFERHSIDTDPTDHLFRYYKPGSTTGSFMEHRSRTTTPPTRSEKSHSTNVISDSQAKEAIFKFLESKGSQGAMLKEFQAKIHVSQTVLKHVLEEIGDYQSRSGQRPRWYLKREYDSEAV